MAQQINLYDSALHVRRVAFGVVHALWAAAGVAGATGAMALLCGHLAVRAQAHADALSAAAQPLQQQVQAAAAAASATAPDRQQAEIAQLRQFEAAQRRVRSLLDAGAAGRREGPSEYFLALARQAHPSLWITGLAISDDGSALELDGRMVDAGVLPDYLRRLEGEPRFKGRSFAQLRLAAVEPAAGSAGLPYTEFTLRSQPTAAGATK